MPNPRLTAAQLEQARVLLSSIRTSLEQLAGGDAELQFAFRRKVYKELIYDERGNPAHRNRIKALKMKEQDGKCPLCQNPLALKDNILDRFHAPTGYTVENTRLICRPCDLKTQVSRGFA